MTSEVASKSTGFINSDGFHLWWRDNQPDEIHLVSSSPVFHDSNGARPGLWITFSCNPKSANYHPQNYNRAARALAEQGCASPALVQEADRRLNARSRLIALWKQAHDQ